MSAEDPKRRRSARRVVARVEKGLADRLEPGESLESAVFGHRYVPGLMVLLFLGTIGDLIYMLVARPYYLALTDRRFFLLDASRWGWIPRPREPVFTADPGSVRIDEPRRFLVRASTTVQAMGESELRLAVHRQYWRELEHMRSLLDSRAAG
ncbi:MAG TPA: hypothetical protein VGK69_11330 [Gaiellaceae bacterium]